MSPFKPSSLTVLCSGLSVGGAACAICIEIFDSSPKSTELIRQIASIYQILTEGYMLSFSLELTYIYHDIVHVHGLHNSEHYGSSVPGW